MNFREIAITKEEALELVQFKEMDYFAVENYNLPIELMMENAGLQLANLIASSTKNSNANILIGEGNGNNGGNYIIPQGGNGNNYNEYGQNGNYNNAPAPISNGAFNNFLKAVENRSFDTQKWEVAQLGLEQNYFTSVQIKRLTEAFSFDNSRLKVAKKAYGRVVDPQNYTAIFEVFSFDSSVNKLVDFMRQNG